MGFLQMKYVCWNESERNFKTWFDQLGIEILRIVDCRDLGSREVREIQRQVGRSDPPPDFQVRLQLKEHSLDLVLCWIDVKCPMKKLGDFYNLNDELYEKYVVFARCYRCPVYLVFYDQIRPSRDTDVVHSTDRMVGWAELEYRKSSFKNRRIEVKKDLPFNQEIVKLMCKALHAVV